MTSDKIGLIYAPLSALSPTQWGWIERNNGKWRLKERQCTDLDLTGIEPLLWRYVPSSQTFVVNENCEAFTPQEEE